MEKLMHFRWVCGFCLLVNVAVAEVKDIWPDYLHCTTEHGILLSLTGPANAKNPVVFSYLYLQRNFYLNTVDYDSENEALQMQLVSAQSMILFGVAETYAITLQGPIDWENLPETLQLEGNIRKNASSFLNPYLPSWNSPVAKIDCQIGFIQAQETEND